MSNNKGQKNTVFISYAREDSGAAKRLHKDLKDAGLTPWLDKESLVAGQNWKISINKAIKKSRYFIPVFSSISVAKRGYIQKEFKYALDVFDEFPESEIFVIPVRLDSCEIPYQKLNDIEYVDLFPRWEDGIKRILQAIKAGSKYDENYDNIVNDSAITTHVLSTSFRGEKRIFVDREEYINNKIKEHLKPSFRVSIIGPGGSGKSQLAFKAIHQYEKEGTFDLVIPIYLDAGVITFDQFLLKIANKLGIPQDQFANYIDIEDRKDIVTDALSKKNNPLILVDNFETLLYAIAASSSSSSSSSSDINDNAIQIKDYLNNNIPDNTSILVTSRERANLNEEKRIDLEGLTEDDSNKLFERLAVDEQLKEVSSQQQKTRQKINDMIKKTGGHPLSIEVLAKNVRSIVQVEQVSEILGSYINKDEPNKRLQSLQESLGFTINKLDDNLKELLSNLMLFKSPFPISAAIQIFAAKRQDVLDLYDRTMLSRIESDDTYGEIKNSEYWLYRLHPAIRNYLDSSRGMVKNLERDYGEAFSQYYWNFLSDTYNEWGKENHVSSIARFNIIAESEYSDFDRAIELARKENREVGAGISAWLGLIFENLGKLTTSLSYHQKTLALDEELNDRVGLAADYKNIGVVLRKMGRLQEALDNHNKALEIDKERNNTVGLAGDYKNIGVALAEMGRLEEALDSHNKALEIDKELSDIVGLAKDYANIGLVLAEMGRLEEALDSHNKALEINKERNNTVGLAGDYKNIGLVLAEMGRLQEALDNHNKALALDEELNDRVGLAADYKNIGIVLRKMGRLQEALDNHNKALEIDKELNNTVGLALDYRNIGNALAEMGRHQEALDSHNKALEINKDLNNTVGMAGDHYNISFVLSNTSKKEALKSLHNALTILQEFEKQNNYHHPLIEQVNNMISYLKEGK